MPKSALPDHIDEPHEWDGTDWDWWGQKWMLKIKHWFAYGPRAKEWWARWREVPIVLFGIKGAGPWRYEYTKDGKPDFFYDENNCIGFWHKVPHPDLYYLAVTQYFSRWHFAVQWPFHVTFHIYFTKDIPIQPQRPEEDYTIRTMFFIRFGARRDADRVYWFPSMFVGGDFN